MLQLRDYQALENVTWDAGEHGGKVDHESVVGPGEVVLWLCVSMEIFSVLLCDVGERGEKTDEWRRVCAHWNSRLCNADGTKKKFTHVMFVGGTHVFDLSFPWLKFKYRSHVISYGDGERVIGPYSNGAKKIFYGDCWRVVLGVLVARHIPHTHALKKGSKKGKGGGTATGGQGSLPGTKAPVFTPQQLEQLRGLLDNVKQPKTDKKITKTLDFLSASLQVVVEQTKSGVGVGSKGVEGEGASEEERKEGASAENKKEGASAREKKEEASEAKGAGVADARAAAYAAEINTLRQQLAAQREIASLLKNEAERRDTQPDMHLHSFAAPPPRARAPSVPIPPPPPYYDALPHQHPPHVDSVVLARLAVHDAQADAARARDREIALQRERDSALRAARNADLGQHLHGGGPFARSTRYGVGGWYQRYSPY